MLQIRPATEADRPFVIGSWLRSYAYARTAGLVAVNEWNRVMGPQLERILDRPGCKTLLAELSGTLAGWIAFETDESPPLVHYCYVKKAYRWSTDRKGEYRGGYVAKRLFDETGIDPAKPLLHTCTNGALGAIRRKGLLPLAKFNPLPARHPKETA